jgi:diacylglycerol kinase family enzyme
LVDGPGEHVPALGIVPGGSGNVLVRAAGLPRDPVEATGVILHGLADHRYRTISLGVANGRWFTMSVGMGLDAEIIAAMEQQRANGKKATMSRYFRTTLTQYFVQTDRKAPALSIQEDGNEPVKDVFAAIILNAAPFTFMGQMPINPLPDASFDAGLDLFAIQDLRVLPMLRWSRRMMAGSRAGSAKGLHVGHDLDNVLLTAERPTSVQIDGEGLGKFSELLIENVPKAIRLVV